LSRQDLAQRLVDPPGILADPHLLALITLQPPYRRAVLDRRFARSSGNVAWHVWDPHTRRRRIRDGLQQPHPALGEREHERGLRERHRPHERLDVQPLAADGQLNQPVGQPEGAQVVIMEGSGHWPFADDPDGVARVVIPFLRQVMGHEAAGEP
jgi:pimeloyl-ACP methyl ester carboxylesterase